MSVADQIKKGREAKGWSQQRLANELGVTRPTISQWEKPETTPKLKKHHILELARLLNRPPSAFTLFGGDTVTTTDDMRKHSIILLRWSDLEHVREGKVLKEIVKKPAHLEVSKDISKKAIALTIEDDSMQPEFHAGEEIVIDPDVVPQDERDFVVVRLQSGEHLFRRYRPRGSASAFDLVAENEEWDTVSVTPRTPATILGTMVEHRKRRRR